MNEGFIYGDDMDGSAKAAKEAAFFRLSVNLLASWGLTVYIRSMHIHIHRGMILSLIYPLFL